jgi:hypothetical protein
MASTIPSFTLMMISLILSAYLLLPYIIPSSSYSLSSSSHHYHTTQDLENMIKLIQIQNQTIYTLSHPHNSPDISISSPGDETFHLIQKLQQKDLEIKQLQQQLLTLKNQQLPFSSSSSTFSSSSTSISSSSSSLSSTYSLNIPDTSFHSECEARYGMKLIDEWKSKKQTWCQSSPSSLSSSSSSSSSGVPESSLICYPHIQKHKNSPDLFCEATNFIIDFSKITGEETTHGKPPRGEQYLDFAMGSLISNCEKTNLFRHFMPHHSLQVDYLPHSLPSSLTPSLPPSLLHSLPPSLTPSLPPSLSPTSPICFIKSSHSPSHSHLTSSSSSTSSS